MKTSPLKKAIITASVLFFISLALSGCASTNARTALRDLQEEGFTDIHVFPTKEDLRPKLFVDKYTFVEIGVDTINSVKILTGEICFRNVITGERKTILPIPEWNRMKSVCYIYSLENNELFFSVVNENLFTVYKYNVKDETLEPIRYINLENKNSIIVSYLDEERKHIYIEQEYERVVYCYDLYSDSQYTNIQPDYIELDNLYPITIFNLDTGQKELYYVEGYNDYFYCLPEYTKIKIDEGQYLTVNRCKRLVSELCILDFKTNSSRLFRLKDFGYEITGLYQVDEDEYCFIVKCQDNSRVFCYFTKDMLESK